MPFGEDWDFHCKLAQVGPMTYSGRSCAIHTIRPDDPGQLRSRPGNREYARATIQQRYKNVQFYE